jgi:hypothetical protein
MSHVQLEEVKNAVEEMTKVFAALAEHAPTLSVRGEDFNAMLKRAKDIISDSPALQDMKDIVESTTVADLLVKLTIIGGAVKAKVHEGMRTAAANSQNRRRSHPSSYLTNNR